MTKRAFTLIELLVVIAIIAILAAILFPVFAQAKLAAKQTKAISNVKQIATSALMYSNDNDDTFAPYAFYPDGDFVNYTWFSEYYHSWYELIDPYVKSPEVFLDPVQPHDPSFLNTGRYSTVFTSPEYKIISNYVWIPKTPWMQQWSWYNGITNQYAGFPIYSNPISDEMGFTGIYVEYEGAIANDLNKVFDPARTAWLMNGYFMSKMTTPGASKTYGDAWGYGWTTDPSAPFFKDIAVYRQGVVTAFADSHAKWINCKRLWWDGTDDYNGNPSNQFMHAGG